MRCPVCHNEMKLSSTEVRPSFNYKNSLPENWLDKCILFECSHCHLLGMPYHLKLKDGSMYVYDRKLSAWRKVKISTSTRNVPKEKIIGGYFVQ